MHLIAAIALVTLLMASVSFAADATSDGAVASIDKFIADQKEAGKIDLEKKGWKTSLPKPPKATFDAKSDYFWIMETNKGTIKIKLLPDVAPMHVSSTIYLARLGFYDDLTFHRVITQFMAQGGCPLGTGTGGPGYKYDGEFDKNVRHNKPGLLSMANAGPGTDGSQFFLTFVPTSWLDGKHTIFGEVVEGMDVVKTLEAGGSENGRTKEALGIKKTTIEVAAKK
jgi:peptidyl-prolyl cis-trans isomerase B (cyclophilin B)